MIDLNAIAPGKTSVSLLTVDDRFVPAGLLAMTEAGTEGLSSHRQRV